MNALKAHVQNGALVLDEPLNLPDGTAVIVQVSNDVDPWASMDPEERAALEQSIEEGYEDFENGNVEDAFGHLARLRSESEGQDRRTSGGTSRPRT